MGLFGGSTKTTTNEQFDSGPSSWQKGYLDDVFGGAQGAYTSTKDSPYYQGSTYAGMSNEAKASLAKLRDYASGAGMNAANGLVGIGTNLSGYLDKAGSTIDQYLSAANEDSTAANIAAANSYANNPYLAAQIDAVGSDVRRNLTESILPNIDRGASAGGNINSSRAGIASGIAQRGAADQIARTAAEMRGNAWSEGLGMAQADRGQRLAALGSAASSYANLGGQGINAMTAGIGAGYDALDRVQASYGLEQADRQGQLDEDFQKWEGEDQRIWDLLGRYSGLVASNQWGQSGTSSGTSKTKQSGSILGQIAGAASAAGSAYASFSDRRLKKMVRKIGEYLDGLGIYVWSYLWQPDSAVNVGVMADEVAIRRPWALGTPVDGFATVNYGKL